MLIEFSVSNFRSFREKQTFSMVAAPRLKKRENVFKPEVKGEKLPDLLKVAAIYGPNASGKSNLIKALSIVRDVTSRLPNVQSAPFPVSPFRFDPELIDKPSWFEFHFICAEQRYEFELALTQERIVYERLAAYPKGKETLLYERQHLPTGDQYTLGEKLEGGKDLHELWKKSTNPQMLFIAQAVANSSEDINQLKNPLIWLLSGFMVIPNRSISEELTDICQKMLAAKGSLPLAEDLASFLQEVDVPITNIRVDQNSENLKSKTILTHRTALGEAEFDFQEQSEGTQNLIGFWLPWIMRKSNSSTGRMTLVVDELDSSLHPEIVASLVAKHIKAAPPTQLIFTTHDTHLMDTKLLRRDQFWLTERDANGATQLRSIHDFEGRESEDIEKRYYEGRYRGLPFIRRG